MKYDIKLINKVAKEAKKEPNPKKLAELLNHDEKTIKEIIKIINEDIKIDSEPSFYDFDKYIKQGKISKELQKTIEKVKNNINVFNEKEQQIITFRFGFKDKKYHTLEELSQKFNITKERARQIEAKVIRKTLHPEKSRKLSDFL
ncbi:MAG: hypothetical protein IJ093_04165 [Bacilli bacterium]|nr:hypothetical protein [Bacilli bacterium]